MKLVEMTELGLDELDEQIKKSRIELVNLRMKFKARQLENPSLISKQRKEIARLLTVQTQKSKEKPVSAKTVEKIKKTRKKTSKKIGDE